MANIDILNKIKQFLLSAATIKAVAFVSFVIVLTAIIASQNFFFQSVIENGVSKKDIIAEKTLTVVDVKRTDIRKK